MGSARYTKEHVNILCAYLKLQHARTVGLLVWYWFIRGAVENVLYEVRSRALCVEYIKEFSSILQRSPIRQSKCSRGIKDKSILHFLLKIVTLVILVAPTVFVNTHC